jgi:histone deacetylase complex regulatory component SIN3
MEIETVVSSVKALFEGHSELLSGFNSFLPKKHQIVIQEEKEVFKKPQSKVVPALNLKSEFTVIDPPPKKSPPAVLPALPSGVIVEEKKMQVFLCCSFLFFFFFFFFFFFLI